MGLSKTAKPMVLTVDECLLTQSILRAIKSSEALSQTIASLIKVDNNFFDYETTALEEKLRHDLFQPQEKEQQE